MWKRVTHGSDKGKGRVLVQGSRGGNLAVAKSGSKWAGISGSVSWSRPDLEVLGGGGAGRN